GDSAGDEGEIFANLVSGKSLTPTELAQLKGENDHAVINLGGQAVEIEMAFSFGTTGYRQFGTSGGDSGSGVSSDSYGNIYVTGYTNGSLPGNTNFGNNDFFVAKYDVYGNRLWVKQFGSAYSDYATGISSESSGNTYVSGRTEGGEDAFVAKYNANGNQLWMAQFGTSGYDSATGVSSDGSGNVYVSGYTDGSFPSYTNLGSYDAFVAKYDTSGNPVWVKQFSTSSHDYAEGISSDSNGNVYVSGKTFGSFLGYTNLGLYDAFVAKYDGNGNQLWLRQFGTSGDDEITGISSDSSDNVYVTGSTKGGLPGYSNLGSYDAFVAKYDGNGNQLWLRQFGTSGNDEITGISRDIDNNVYVTGYTTGSLPGNINAGGSDAFVAKYNANGTLNWVRQFGTSAADSANGIRIDSSGNVYVTGDTSGGLPGNSNSGSSDAFVVGFDSDGNILNNIYSNNFETSAGSEWSKTNRSTTPIGGRKFLGEFSNDTVSLTLNNPLLNNNTITVEFDLFIIRYWDGNTGYADSNYGDATFTLTTSNGQTLFNTTFSNYDTTTQSYPNSAGQGNYPARTGAVENNTLGYQNWYGGPKSDSVYHLTSTFTNASNLLSLNFTASGLQLWYNTSDVGSWGIDNISVRVLDVPTITLAVSPASVTEDGTSNLIYTFTRTGSTTNPLTINYSIGGTATNGTDYASIPTGITFAAGLSTATVTVNPTNDTAVENNETVALTLASGTGYTIGTATAVTGTITNDDFSKLSINNITVVEGQNSNAILTVTVDNPNPQPITFNYTTAPINATANVDYTSKTGTITIAPNTSTATISIPILNDNLNEANETFAINLSNPVNATLTNNKGIVTISDTLTANVTTTLPANVENLTLTGSANINGTGNAGNNNITGNSGNNQINGRAGIDTLTGGLGADTFIFQFGQSTISASDSITDFAINSDKIDLLTQGGLATNAPISFSRATDSTTTTLQNLINQVFTDANGAITGNQGLGVNSAALVQVTTGAIAGTYLVINDSTAGFQSSNDLLINITGFTGTLPALGSINVSSFFI
ncbi:SBBP repeat-containing protein, partial [Microcystis aeruginosa]|uniref:SBBP repeat-containing protein n=1 Tax=Microcystis aeruginosa TaxID=1126 RepID=UPI0009B704C1